MAKKTAVIGASDNPARYSYLAANMLRENGHTVVPLGIRKGFIGDLEIVTEWPKRIEDLDTVTMYIGPKRQPELYDYILALHPKRIVFNPGTENDELRELARSKGIATENACTLVLLSTGQY
ncbi:MAG: CoA-binding protein [Cryomorphaceae bacterium]